MSTPLKQSHFPTTQWTLIRKLAEPAMRDAAVEDLVHKYWSPVYSFLCRRLQASDAEDVTQEFFLLVLRQQLFERAQQEQGKLRSWLLKSLHYFLANRYRTELAQKRGGGRNIYQFDNDQIRDEMTTVASRSLTPDEAFERAWLANILRNTLDALRQQYENSGHGTKFEKLLPFLVEAEDDLIQASAAAELGMTTPNFRVQLHRLRKRYAAELRTQIAETLGPGADVEEELQTLFQISEK